MSSVNSSSSNPNAASPSPAYTRALSNTGSGILNIALVKGAASASGAEAVLRTVPSAACWCVDGEWLVTVLTRRHTVGSLSIFRDDFGEDGIQLFPV